ncbi:hypothetical protein P618_200028 [Holospora obtusa F1]|uniref:Transmembrane protein n=1 Tax=Holospora obtusa F1 TaxID=1399147 RepID=W6TVF0_HOLOB|nr:hypothetical protein [Holospora obtusa]ETZ07757.1 hypothetical protein P618_200028 [Holospora obtusa F1]
MVHVMHSQSYVLNKALLEIRSSFIFSSSFYLRFWFALGSFLAVGSIFGFWTSTFAPYPGSTQIRIWKDIAQLKAPLVQQLSYDYVQALEEKNFFRAQALQCILQESQKGHQTVTKLYVLEKKSFLTKLEDSLCSRVYRNFRVAALIFSLSPIFFLLGFYLLRKYLRKKGYKFQGRLLFFRIATPSIFKLAGLICWGYSVILSYQVLTPSYWTEASSRADSLIENEYSDSPMLSKEQVHILTIKQQTKILQEYWIKSLLFYSFFGGIIWILGRRWDQLPLKNMSVPFS